MAKGYFIHNTVCIVHFCTVYCIIYRMYQMKRKLKWAINVKHLTFPRVFLIGLVITQDLSPRFHLPPSPPPSHIYPPPPTPPRVTRLDSTCTAFLFKYSRYLAGKQICTVIRKPKYKFGKYKSVGEKQFAKNL